MSHPSSQAQPSFVVALPMYNEQANAEKCVRAVFKVTDDVPLRSAVVAINDGSRDATLRILEGLQPSFSRLHVVDHMVNGGYGAAIRSGYRFGIEQGYDYVLFMDADLTQDPRYILDFIPHMRGGIDFIKASRYIRGSRVLGVPRNRIIVSSFGNGLARLVFGLPITDYTNGFRAVKTTVATNFQLTERGFAVLVEEAWQAKYYARTFREVSYTLGARANAADSKFRYNFRVYRDYLKYCGFSLFRIHPQARARRRAATRPS